MPSRGDVVATARRMLSLGLVTGTFGNVSRREGEGILITPSGLDYETMTGDDLVLLKSIPQRQLAAWLFVRWLSEPPQTARWAIATGGLPLRRSATQGPELTAWLAEHPQYAEALALLPYARADQAAASHHRAQQAAYEILVAVARGADPVTTLDQAAAQFP